MDPFSSSSEPAESSLPGHHTTIILTRRLLLRPLSYTYLPGIFAHRANGAILHWKAPDAYVAASRAWVSMLLRSPKCWNFVVHHRPASLRDSDVGPQLLYPSEEDRNAIIGMCGVHTAPEVGYSFTPEVWGKGFASEAIAGLVEKYWETFPDGHPSLQEHERGYLEAHTTRENLSSQGVLRKNGFEFWNEVEESSDIGGGPREMMMVWRRWKPGTENRTEGEKRETANAIDEEVRENKQL